MTGWFVPTDENAAEAANPIADDTSSHPAPNSSNENGNGPKNMGKSPADSAAKASPPSKSTSPAKAGDESPLPAETVAKIVPRIARSKPAGIDLLVCPTGVKDVVTIDGVFPAFDSSDPVLGDLAADMLERGTTKHDTRAIAALLDEVGRNFNAVTPMDTSSSQPDA